MIATQTAVFKKSTDAGKFSPIFRIKNTRNSNASMHTHPFLNFTVWWETMTTYSKKTYSTNVCMHKKIISSTENGETVEKIKYVCRLFLVDETPGNQEFEVIALTNGKENQYTTYYVNAPASDYDNVTAKVVVNNCNLLPSIEFLGNRPFNVTVSDYDEFNSEIASDDENYEEKIVYAVNHSYNIANFPIDTTSVSIEHKTGSFDVSSYYNNMSVIKDGYLYIDYVILGTDSATGTMTDILTLNGMKLTEELHILAPYGYSSGTGGGMCEFTITTDGIININYASPNMLTRLTFTLNSSQYTLT